MKIPLTSDALFDTMPANTSFQMLSRFSLAGPPFKTIPAAGSVASFCFFPIDITPLPSRRT